MAGGKENYERLHGIELTGVNKVTVHNVTPESDTAYLRGVRTMSIEQYNKWYRRVWRWIRGLK